MEKHISYVCPQGPTAKGARRRKIGKKTKKGMWNQSGGHAGSESEVAVTFRLRPLSVPSRHTNMQGYTAEQRSI